MLIRVYSLFFFSGAIAGLSGSFGPGSGPIILHDVTCSGSEYSLFECGYQVLETSNCAYYQTAEVTCAVGM